jgi:hypothetical protein
MPPPLTGARNGEGRYKQHPAFSIWAIEDKPQHSQLLAKVVLRDVPMVQSDSVSAKVLRKPMHRRGTSEPGQGTMHYGEHRDGTRRANPLA